MSQITLSDSEIARGILSPTIGKVRPDVYHALVSAIEKALQNKRTQTIAISACAVCAFCKEPYYYLPAEMDGEMFRHKRNIDAPVGFVADCDASAIWIAAADSAAQDEAAVLVQFAEEQVPSWSNPQAEARQRGRKRT